MLNSTDNYNVNFTGLTHDHSVLRADSTDSLGDQIDAANVCSVITILRRHPMYDSLVLVKKYRNCLKGYALEFPTDKLQEEDLHQSDASENQDQTKIHLTDNYSQQTGCSSHRLVSRYVDGDDPMHRANCANSENTTTSRTTTPPGATIVLTDQTLLGHFPEAIGSCLSADPLATNADCLVYPFMQPQLDDKSDNCELVHVPINGLMDRLENYTRNQVAVDCRVYAFAMGLKTAERIMTTKSMKELQETPI